MMKKNTPMPSQINLTRLIFQAIIRILLFGIIFFFIFWGISGDLAYWEAWIYFGILFFWMGIFMIYLIHKDPEFLQRRLNLKEKENTQKRIVFLGTPLYILIYVLPPLDRRYGWSALSIEWIILGFILTFSGYFLMIKVFFINRWASRTIEVKADQKVISTGLYGFIRHPMYLGVWIMFMGTPLALGSVWGLIAPSLSLIFLVLRILDEERILARDLSGYDTYMNKVKYRMFRGIF